MDSIVFDALGANGSSSTSRVEFSVLAEAVSDFCWPSNAQILACAEDLMTLPYELALAPASFPGCDAILSRGDRPAAFIPLQLHDDANLLIYSEFETPAEVVRRTVGPLADSGFLCVVKPHPATATRPGGLERYEDAFQEAQKYRDRVVWLDLQGPRVPNPILFGWTDCVVTVNSSVGFEALYHDKPVVVLGQAVYKPNGIFPSLEDLCQEAIDEVSYQAKVSILREYFLSSYLVTSREAFACQEFFYRVLILDSCFGRFGCAAEEYVRDSYQAFAESTRKRRRAALMAGS